MAGTSFVDLPAELRVLIYEDAAHDDLLAFAVSFRRPALLAVRDCGIGREYSDIFFDDKHLTLDAYCTEVGTWRALCGAAAKQSILRGATFHALLDRSLPSAQRYTARKAVHRLMARYGLLTLFIGGAPRLFLWECYD